MNFGEMKHKSGALLGIWDLLISLFQHIIKSPSAHALRSSFVAGNHGRESQRLWCLSRKWADAP